MRSIAFVALAVLIGAALIGPAGAHVGGTVDHLWGAPRHIKDKATRTFYTKQRADTRFVNIGEKASNSEKIDGIDSTEIVPGLGGLKQGATLRGAFALGDTATGSGDFTMGSISFGFSLGSAPEAHWIVEGGVAPAECPGSVSSPEAQAGHLCIYEDDRVNVANYFVNAPDGVPSPSAAPWGATIQVGSTASGDYWSYGSWAVTAP